jgi:hypothetical protein
VVARDFQSHHCLRLHRGTQEVSNSLAVDEEGGIYVVSDRSTSRVQWSRDAATPLALGWSLPYKTRSARQIGRVGSGSGTTPTLIGSGDDDKLVAICDGQQVMHLVLYWRDEIPADWAGLPGRDRRIAADVPVRFGDRSASSSTTEQSLVVRGHEIAVVSNVYGSFRPIAQRYIRRRLGEDLHTATIYKSNDARIAPHGIEKFAWDSSRRRLTSSWANRRISCPNGVPVMSEATGMLYCIGQRDGQWTLEALNWETGESAFHRRLSSAAKYNSFFAATQVGADGSVITGTYGGILKFGSTE